MNEVSDKIKVLDGKQLYYSFLSGAQRIFEHQQYLNQINVFPVPDADTGTNLAATMRSIMDTSVPNGTVKEAALVMADAALNGARGNSGIIFAQFLYGFSAEIKSEADLDIRSFAESVKNAVAYAYDAIANPVEGTILTVIKAWADYIYALREVIDDFGKLLYEGYLKALESLAETTRKLDVLTRANVVDAGAKGFVYFLEGWVDFFTQGGLPKMQAEEVVPQISEAALEDIAHEEFTFRYCTELILTGKNLDKRKISEKMLNCGDSLVIAGMPQKMRVHIHTDFPAEVVAQLQRFGTISFQKVDDMKMQYNLQHHRQNKIGIITDSTSDLPQEFIDRYQISVVPLIVNFGERYYLDRLTMNASQYYHLFENSDIYPKTSQPSAKDFTNRYEYVAGIYDEILGIHITHGMSGTYQNAEKASRDTAQKSGKKIVCINSKTLTGGLGLIVVRAAQELEKGATLEQVRAKVDEWVGKSSLRVGVRTMKYIVKSGRVSPVKGWIAKTLDLKAVIALNEEGKAELHQKAFSKKKIMSMIFEDIRKLSAKQKIWNYVITHANDAEYAEIYRHELTRIIGKEPLYIEQASPALGANAGPGVVCVSWLYE